MGKGSFTFLRMVGRLFIIKVGIRRIRDMGKELWYGWIKGLGM